MPSSAESPAAVEFVDQERLSWLALALTPGLGPRRVLRAIREVGSAEDILHLPLTGLEALQFPVQAVQFIADGKALDAANTEIEALIKSGANFLAYNDPDYPERLREIFDAPALLWIRGDAKLLAKSSIAVVGTRHPTPYGSGMSEMLSRDLAARGMVILSGMARGVDTAAHKGALAAKGKTVAVWGTGIDVIYPKENKSLAEQILASGGAIVSEMPTGTFPAPQNFPKRNRIISGMSVGVLVVEAGEHSGTRVTARCALEQNRDVFAVPGNVTTKNAWGPNTLIKQGAKLVATWEDVWEELPSQVRLEIEAEWEFASKAQPAASLFEEAPLPPAETRVMSALRHDEALQLDEIMEKLEPELSSSEVFTALFELELAGRIKQLPGKNYVKSF
ncbi:DNA-protecting protein DprA [Alloacidobacterium dinghuense]|uniref:DNA-protecting protein DprA n=1 Tax=Alloacidobacterium dinghuense TaxID=2763107 RepID=A0A7G8BQ90_9BACT|nr:DNA-processing protein DprA [Alloacidobacterium dinghuense]QNI34710.1 DNA-protecting protein DprA [Alloacidobacterium dinghuense]